MGHYGKYKVAILGFGMEGQDAARYFLGQGSTITVFDQNDKDSLVGLTWLDKPIEWRMGKDYLDEGLKGFDIIVRSPGFYRYRPEIVEAEKEGAKITSNTQLFFEESEANIIGVTGTKGKGTTARMLQLGLEKAGLTTLLLGNVGEPMLDRIPDADTFDWVVLELSSFQLIDLTCSPHIAVVTNITTDHLNWHKDRNEYVHSKENLWKHQKPEDFAVFNYDDETLREFSKDLKSQAIWYSAQNPVEKGAYAQAGSVISNISGELKVADKTDLGVPGNHNLSNALGALAAATVAGADPVLAWEGIKTFSGVEHRQEIVATKKEVLYINDSAATTTESSLAAVNSYPQDKILIAGGSLKGTTFGKWAEGITQSNTKVVFLIGESKDQMETALKGVNYSGQIITNHEDMKSIIDESLKLSKSGDVVLLSPGCASFGLFKNYRDRGDAFKEAVSNI